MLLATGVYFLCSKYSFIERFVLSLEVIVNKNDIAYMLHMKTAYKF